MYRYIASTFGVGVIVVSVLGVLNPGGGLSILVNTSVNIAVLRVIFSVILLAYSVSPLLRYDFLRDSLLFAGTASLAFLIYSLFSDSLPFPEPLDLYFVLQGAIVSFIAGIDFARPKAVQRFLPNITMADLLIAKVKSIRMAEVPGLRKVSLNR